MRNVFKQNLPLTHKVQIKKYYRNRVKEANLANVAVLFVESFSLDTGKIDFPI